MPGILHGQLCMAWPQLYEQLCSCVTNKGAKPLHASKPLRGSQQHASITSLNHFRAAGGRSESSSWSEAWCMEGLSLASVMSRESAVAEHVCRERGVFRW